MIRLIRAGPTLIKEGLYDFGKLRKEGFVNLR